MSGYQVHPDEMSTWCRSKACGACEDDLCECDCHYDDEPPTPKWRTHALLWAVYIAVLFSANLAVELVIHWAPLRVAGYAVVFLLMVFFVYPWLQRRIGGK